MSSVHTSRTMMLSELSLVLDHVAATARADEYHAAIVERNVLGKPTQTTRQRTATRLAQLYALDPNIAIFRMLRHFWAADPTCRPMLACLGAAARDPLLWETTPFVLALPTDTAVGAVQIAQHLEEMYPARFKAATRNSAARNLASTWTQAGYLTGKVNKKRSRPVVTPVATAFTLVLGYLSGIRGKMLLSTPWVRLLDRSPAEVIDLVTEASRRGWLNYRASGSVVEITFPGLLTPQEEGATRESD